MILALCIGAHTAVLSVVNAAMVSLNLPYERGLNDGVRLPGDPRFQVTDLAYVTPEYFRTMRIPLFQGREFTAGDGAQSGGVAIVNLAFAARYFKAGGALDRPVTVEGKPWTIVVGNIQQARAGAALALERFLRSFLWGVQSTDAITFAAVAAALLAATVVASFAPAARIARLNPADTLRSQ